MIIDLSRCHQKACVKNLIGVLEEKLCNFSKVFFQNSFSHEKTLFHFNSFQKKGLKEIRWSVFSDLHTDGVVSFIFPLTLSRRCPNGKPLGSKSLAKWCLAKGGLCNALVSLSKLGWIKGTMWFDPFPPS